MGKSPTSRRSNGKQRASRADTAASQNHSTSRRVDARRPSTNLSAETHAPTRGTEFLDTDGLHDRVAKLVELGVPVCLIGPPGTGKTTMLR
ncbi:MAG: ATP-binding protein, partial [Planctomycetales bacterium]|nr:ATP-binding protein [Planctomycetales bacterium]